MLPLPAFVPGGFICSSKRLGAVPCDVGQGKWATQMGRPRAGIANDCVIIFRLYLEGVNGTESATPKPRGTPQRHNCWRVGCFTIAERFTGGFHAENASGQ